MKEKLESYRPFLVPVVLIALSMFFYFIDRFFLGSCLLLIYFIQTVYKFYSNQELLQAETDNIEKIASKIKTNINDNISNMVYPIVLMKENGDIIWANVKFNKEIALEKVNEQNIISIARNLDLMKLLKCDKDLSQRIKIKDCFYSIYANKLVNDSEDKSIYIVYFIEVSNLKDLNTTKESVMLIEVDNLTEALDTTEEGNRPMLVADVEKIINAYAQKMKAMIVKYDTNKYALSVLDKYINDEINAKFDILDKISTVERGNKLEVTLSIGVGRGSSNPQENYHNAATAKELALGRGGDQVVVKSNEKIVFFGGNTREVEKRTRVRARVISQALKELIFESSNVFIIGHKNPDMDCLGAAVGLHSVIKQLGKNCSIILDNDTNAIEYYLARIKADSKHEGLFISSEEAERTINEKTLLIVVDVHNNGYVNNLKLVEKVSRKIIIDHHRRSPDIIEGALLNYIEVYASSTSEMVTELIQYMLQKPRISKVEAEGLLAGIVMDTKGFQFKSGVRTFDAASFLRTLGADPLEVKKMFADDLSEYLIIAETIKNAKVKKNIAIAICPSNVFNTSLIARAADKLLTISGIEVCFVLCEVNGSITISARSLSDINVQVICEEIGGGGHMNMAGAKINKTMEEAIELLQKAIAKHIK